VKFSNGKQQSSKRLAGLGVKFSFLFTTTAFAQAEPPVGGPETFPWLIIPILLVFLAAIFFWFGRSIYGRKGCAVGAVRRRTFVGVVLPPSAQSQAAFEPTGQTLKELRTFPWITFDVPVAVLGPDVTEVTEKKVCLNRVRGQIKTATHAMKEYQQTDHGVDIIAKLTSEIGTPSLLSGNYWKKKTRTGPEPLRSLSSKRIGLPVMAVLSSSWMLYLSSVLIKFSLPWFLFRRLLLILSKAPVNPFAMPLSFNHGIYAVNN